jgi:hypothetical protein
MSKDAETDTRKSQHFAGSLTNAQDLLVSPLSHHDAGASS